MTTATSERAVGRWRAVAWVLFGLLIVSHGCHADRDTELRARPAVGDSCEPTTAGR